MSRRSLIVALAFWPCLAAARTVYRCDAEGRIYSQKPCADGQAIDVSDPRSAAERADGKAVAERMERLADAMERERLAAEQSRRPGVAVSLGGKPAGPADASPTSQRGQRKSNGPKPRGRPTKVRRTPGNRAPLPSGGARPAA